MIPTKLEWLKQRGWNTFQDFMIAHGYNPQSVEDYMKAQTLYIDIKLEVPRREKKKKGDRKEDQNESGEMEGVEEREEDSDSTDGDGDEEDSDSTDGDGDEDEGDEGDEGDERYKHPSVSCDNWKDSSSEKSEEEAEDSSSISDLDFTNDNNPAPEEKANHAYAAPHGHGEVSRRQAWLSRNGWEHMTHFMNHHSLDPYDGDHVVHADFLIKQDMRIKRGEGELRTGLEDILGGWGVDVNMRGDEISGTQNKNQNQMQNPRDRATDNEATNNQQSGRDEEMTG
ncbi:hypothetical protein NHQ30_001950 [Ciborinia camelliae]|nr:hypothetical protein NHQ30_001950 [Ciborinia camelliae]